VGAKKALQQQLKNVAFLRIDIDKVNEFFGKDEVAEIWITFPDPQLRKSKDKKRLTHPKFLRLYQQFLVPGGLIHLKTDSPDLYDFTRMVTRLFGCQVVIEKEDIYSENNITDELSIKTYYESKDIAESNRVHYLCFTLPPVLPGREMDRQLKQYLKDDERVD
jgi:tRNA (guanine-N7-)-methyltransferase